MIGFYDYTVIATYVGFAFAVAGCRFAYLDRPMAALVCLLAAGLCDAFDGKIARTKKGRTESEKKFGIQIDSLSDMVCFGILPSMIGCSLCRGNSLMIAIMVLYSLTALIRLAYFNVTEEERQSKTTENRKEYLGLPVTSSALLIPFLFCFRPIIGDEDFAAVYAVVLAVTGALFITPLHIRKPGSKLLPLLALIGLAIAVILLLESKAA